MSHLLISPTEVIVKQIRNAVKRFPAVVVVDDTVVVTVKGVATTILSDADGESTTTRFRPNNVPYLEFLFTAEYVLAAHGHHPFLNWREILAEKGFHYRN